MPHPKTSIIEVYSGTMWEAQMLKTLLGKAKINSYLKNTTLNSYAYEPIQSEGVQVMILSSDAPEAQLIIAEYARNKQNYR